MIQYTEKTDALGGSYIEGVIGNTLMIIPIDPANSDYQSYLRWVENPNEVEHLTEIPTE